MIAKPALRVDEFADMRHPDVNLSEQEARMWILSAAERKRGVKIRFNPETQLWEKAE